MLKSPFLKLSKSSEKSITLILLTLLIICMISIRYFDAFLINTICENGIVSFELAKDLDSIKAILNSWNEQAKIAASLSMGFDFLFLIVYASFMALLIHKLNERFWKNKPFYKIGTLLIWTTFLAALFDAIENIALIRLLLGDLQQQWASVAYYFAVLKFITLLIGILYIIINFGLLLTRKSSNE